MMKKLVAILLLALPIAAAAQVNTGNLPGTLMASAAQTAATVNTADQTNYSYRGVAVIINVSAWTAGSYTPHIQGKDPVSGAYYDILVGTAIGATGTTVLKVYPGITPAANGAASDVIPRTWRLQLIGATGQSMTLSVGIVLEP